MKFLAALVMLMGVAVLGVEPARAIGEDVFVVPRVPVQAQAESATKAKAIAQARGRRRAMDILLRRLTVEEDWIYLPRLSRGEPAAALEGGDIAALARPSGGTKSPIVLESRDLELLESGFEVNNEKSSPSTYRAFITYRFKPAAVRRLLRNSRIPYSEAQTRTALVLPVLQTETGLYLWEDNNPWLAAWRVRPYNNELTPMAAPLGDLEDQVAVKARQALSLEEAGMRGLAERYGVSQVIVAHAYLKQIEGEDRLQVRLINGYRESGEIAPIEELGTIEGAGATSDGFTVQSGDYAISSAKVGDVLADAFFRRESGNFPLLAEAAIETAIAKYASEWKARTLIDYSAAGLLETTAFFDSITDWTKIRAALVETPLVGSVQVNSLSRRGAELLVRSYGDPTKLIVAMEAQGLALWTPDNERWFIATPTTAQELRRSGKFRGRSKRLFGENDGGDDLVRPAAYPDGVEGAESKIESRF